MPRVEIDFVGNDQTGGITDPVISSFTELQSAIALVERGLGYAKKAFDETVGATVSYADEIRSLQQVTGGSAEETSKLIQVLDDYKVSSQSAMLAQRSLTKQGIVLTTESLAELSKRYLEITDQTDRNAFAQKNLGRSYKDFIEVLQQGPDAINKASDAVNRNMILTRQSVETARQYQFATDTLGDSLQSLAYGIGQDALPAVVSLTKALADGADGWAEYFADRRSYIAQELRTDEILKSQGLSMALIPGKLSGLTKATKEQENAARLMAAQQIEQEAATRGATSAMGDEADQALILAEQQKAAADAINATTAANNGLLSLTMKIKGENDNYDKSVGDLTAKHTELVSSLETLKTQGWDNTSQSVVDATQKIKDNEQAMKDLAGTHEQAMKKIAYDLFVVRLQADGFTDAEFNIAIQAGVTAGVIDQKSAEMAISMNEASKKAQALAEDLIRVPSAQFTDGMNAAAEAARRLAGEYVVSIKTIYSEEGRTNYASGAPTGGGVIHARAAGGAASGMTLVGERGPELVNLPGGSRVYSNQDSRNMMSGGGMTVNLNIASGGVIADPQEFARQITPALKYALRDMGVR